MGKMLGIFACLVIVALDVIAGILGIRAEAAQNQEKHLRLWLFECKEPSHDAYLLGLAAASLVCLAHVLANLLGGCCTLICEDDVRKAASPSKQLSIACLVVTWVIFVGGVSMVGIGTLANQKSRASCGLAHHHFFSIGGILCMLHALFAVASYVTSKATS